jgi:plastocyanin
MKRLMMLLLACLALVAAGCGDDDEEPAPAGGGGATATQEEETGGTSASGEVVIDMKDFQFEPKNATVKVGQTVKWVNQDSAPHDATDEEGGQFKSDQFGKGESYEFTAEKAGKIDYVCTLHPGMEGTLTVTN